MCSLKARCVTLFSYSISHNFPALKHWNESLRWSLKNLGSQNNRVPKEASIWEIKGDIFVSSEICRINKYKCKWGKIDMLNRRGCNASVNSSYAQPPPPPGWPPGISIFFVLDGKFPGVGTEKEGKCPVLRQHCNIFYWSHSRVVPF